MPPAHLFVYGTLRPGHAPPEIASTVALLQPIGPGTIRARLYQFTGYTGAVLLPSSPPIPGEIFELPADPVVLHRVLDHLDFYEDFRSDDPADSLFLRVEAPVTLPDGSDLPCWIYVYNYSLPSSET